MKTLLKLSAAALILVAGSASAQITGTAHDFSADTWNPGDEICQVCHTPHNADTNVSESVLWNHEVTAATFTPYSSPTLTATDVAQPSGNSKLCLSCHDGTVALDSFGGLTGTNFLTGDALVGINLVDDHPISFAYNAALVTADGGLNDTTDASGIDGGTIAEDMLFNNSLECASCHDVHNGYALPNLLRKTNSASALCLTCHDK